MTCTLGKGRTGAYNWIKYLMWLFLLAAPLSPPPPPLFEQYFLTTNFLRSVNFSKVKTKI